MANRIPRTLTPPGDGSRLGPPVMILTGIVTAWLYLRSLCPGVAEGDSGELQWTAALGGIAHAPGYAIQITVGRLFAALPVGPGVAWRLNLMSAFFGVVGVLALWSAVRGMTGRVLPATVAAVLLGCSSVYWSHAMIAEVYVFGAALLACACDASVRYLASGRARWLYAAAIGCGCAVAERPSEGLVVPAFLACWYAFRHLRPITARRAGYAAVCATAPFLVALGLNLARSAPDRLAVRDDALRDRIIGYHDQEVTFDYTRPPGLAAGVRAAVGFMTGERWSARLTIAGAGSVAENYLWMLGGGCLIGSRGAPEGQTDPMLSGGMSVGPLGCVLALWGAWSWARRRPGWVLLGGGLFAGNLVFLLAYRAWDSLTFTCPGVIGLSLLAGLGCAGAPGSPSSPSRNLWGGLGLAAALMTVPINVGPAARDTPEARAMVDFYRRVEALPFPADAVVLTKYWPAMALRYSLWIEARREDISVIHTMRGAHLEIAASLHNEGRPVYLTRGLISDRVEHELSLRTPEAFRSMGFLSLESMPSIPLTR